MEDEFQSFAFRVTQSLSIFTGASLLKQLSTALQGTPAVLHLGFYPGISWNPASFPQPWSGVPITMREDFTSPQTQNPPGSMKAAPRKASAHTSGVVAKTPANCRGRETGMPRSHPAQDRNAPRRSQIPREITPIAILKMNSVTYNNVKYICSVCKSFGVFFNLPFSKLQPERASGLPVKTFQCGKNL